MSEAVREAALCAHRAGLCVFPPKEDGSKAPDTSEWKTRQAIRTTEAEVLERTGLSIEELRTRSFLKIMEARRR